MKNKIVQRVAIQNVRFFAYHGFYPEEQLLGCEFFVDIIAAIEVKSSGDDDISRTVNYEKLYEIASIEMKNTQKLIESVAHNILNSIRHKFIAVNYISVRIRKIRPPMKAEIGHSSVELIFERQA